MNDSWKSDPRLNGMDPKRLALLSGFAETLKNTPDNQKMNAFLTVNRQAAEQGLQFTKAESELLITILSEELSPAEKKRVEMIKTLAGRMRRSGK